MMDGYYYPAKMKRKDLEDVSYDFSDFSLSSPARKIRRLDTELPPIIEEDEMEVPIIEHSGGEQSFGNNEGPIGGGSGGIGAPAGGVVIEELPSELANDERAIVLFRPVDSPLISSPSNFSVTLCPDLISGFKNQVLWSNQSKSFRGADDELFRRGENSGATNNCMAVVPWVPSQLPSAAGGEAPSQNDFADMMDAEDMEGSTMDVEDSDVSLEKTVASGAFGAHPNEGIHQWQQQHCMIPQPPQNTSTPIVWYR